MENIIAEAQKLVQGGCKELILIAQDTTNYGIDLYKERKLPQLIKELLKIEGLCWLRLLPRGTRSRAMNCRHSMHRGCAPSTCRPSSTATV
jgi:tRNA A37 methylthiotransferase MiaB